MKKKNIIINAFPIALFAFAGRALTVGRGVLVDGLAAVLLAFAAIPVAAWASNSVFGEGGIRSKKSMTGRILYSVFALFSAAAALCIAAVSAREFSVFASEVMLVRIPSWGVTAVFLGFCAYLSGGGMTVLRKFSFVAFLITSVAVLVLFLLSVPNFEMPDVRELLDLGEISIGGAASAFGGIFAPSVIAVIYLSAGERREKNGVRPLEAFLAVLLSGLLLLVCYLNVRLLLGGSFGPTRDYPYSEAVSTVTAGKLFARMEGFAYVMYYAVTAVKTAVSVALVCLLAKNLLPRRTENKKSLNALPYAVSVIVWALSAIL